MNNLKTTLIALVALLAASTVSAGAYVVYENDVAFDKFDSLGSFDDTRSDIRLGTSVGIGYVEVGKFGNGFSFDTGTSAEAGVSKSVGNFQFKAKVESFHVDDWSHKLETNVRYNF
jgi:hypothetical protein|tara:strand:+ start:948 stop:1295 length:348 start_codon:yes stop_codon:yes gene_type:complete